MEYAISAAIVVIFVLIYLLTKNRVRPLIYEIVPDDLFDIYAKSLITLPDGKNTLNAAAYARHIKWVMLKISRKKYDGFADDIVREKEFINEISKMKFNEALPSVNGVPRALILARAALGSMGGEFSEERVAKIMSMQNAAHTITYEEIAAMKNVFCFAVLTDLSRLLESYNTLIKIRKIAARYVGRPIKLPKRYIKLSKSALFLSICADVADYRADEYGTTLSNALDALRNKLTTVKSSYRSIVAYDFSRYYIPLEIYTKYEVFADADVGSKSGFLSLAGRLSDRENVDEFIFAVRVDKYMHSASSGHMDVKKLSIFNRRVRVISQKEDISMLAAALGSRYFMQLFFKDNSNKKIGSISKNNDFENSFEPIYRYHTVNFGISTKGGRLRLSPHLPPQVVSADVVFSSGNTLNNLRIERGKERALFLGDTRLEGTDEIRLGRKPLSVRMTVPYEQ